MSSSYSDDTVRTKLSALNDTQDSIVAVAQWIMFHRRTAQRSAELWFERLKDASSHKKLTLIYLANEIIQQSKAKAKIEFFTAFTPLIVDGTEVAYKGCPPDIQNRIRRVIQVWREREIFKPEVQAQIEQRLDAVDKNKGARPGKPAFGGGLKLGSGFLGGGSKSGVPAEFEPLMKTHKEISEKASSVTINTGSANTEFRKQFDTEQLPAAPVYAARLSALLKTLDSAEISVKGAIEARKAHIRNIEKLLEQSKIALAKDEQTAADIAAKKERTETTKANVEKLILEGMEENGSNGDRTGTPRDKTPELRSPEIEALTPPEQIQYQAEPPVPASELHHRHSIASAEPPQPPGFHVGASELLASLSAPLHASALKRPHTEDTNMFDGIDEDLVSQFQSENAQKKPKVGGPPVDDEYVP